MSSPSETTRILNNSEPSYQAIPAIPGVEEENFTKKRFYQRLQYALFVGVIVIEIVLAIKLCLITTKYGLFLDAACDPNSTANASNATSTVTPDVMLLDSDIPEYHVNGKRIRPWGTMHVLLFLFALFISSLNMLEYLQLGWGTHKYLVDLKKHSSSDSPSMSSEVKPPWKSISKCLIIAAIVFFLCSVPILKFGVGVLMEIQKSGCIEEDSSGGNLARVYVTYCIFEVLNAIVFACSVRVLMVVQLFKIQSVWFRNKAPSQLPPGADIKKVVRDAWHAEKKEYETRGKQVKRMMKPFKYWYLTPWIMFLFMTFINPHTLLTPWTRYEESKLLSMSQIYYLLFVILKAIQLFIQNACAVQMNVYHREYYRKMVRRFKKGVTDDENKTREYQEEARDFSFVFNDKFNFYPNILCIDAKINVDTPFYVLSLVIGIFVTASDGLFK